MAINMQGSWTVSVKSVETFEPPQHFVISGAASGNGTYSAATATPPVYVTGDHWAISIQMNRGAGFVDIPDQITFPSISGGNYHFDIQANFPPDDPIFDDVILTCSTPVTLEDYLIYGSVSYYSDGCIFNPCFLPYLVIDTPAALLLALQNPYLRVPIEKLYPDRLRVPPPPPPGPMPDPPPFSPLVIPLRGQTAIPTKVGQVFKVQSASTRAEGKKLNAAAKEMSAETEGLSVLATRQFDVSAPAQTALDFNRVEVANIVDHLIRLCETGPLPGVVLRFQEYDRTNAELAGGAYTGTGNHENLGVCATDRNGNYIFRFSRTLAQYFHEAAVDVAPGENILTQILPDVIVQLLDSTKPTGFCYESAPYWNIPFIQQINICVPKGCIGRLPTACQGANAIQAIGNIFIGAPQMGGSRVGFNNFLGTEGRITAKNTLPDVPPARCAAWAGALDLFACFIDHPEVTQYTIRVRALGELTWNFFQELYTHPEIAKIGIPGYSGTKIGPFSRPLEIDGVPNTSAQAYDNIENNPAFVLTHRDRKAVISSWLYPPVHGLRRYGSVQFRIEGYNAGGGKVAAADDTITLYIDNNGPDFDIASVNMQGQTGGDCALFNLQNLLNTPLTVRFRANQLEGFLSSYQLSVRKGNTIPDFAIDDNGPGLISGVYVHGDDLICNSFEGTFDDLTHDGSGYVSADVVAHSGHWLEPGQPFCTFAIRLGCSIRVTNGYNSAVYGYGPVEYLLGIQAS
jgi:hypothetical protein